MEELELVDPLPPSTVEQLLAEAEEAALVREAEGRLTLAELRAENDLFPFAATAAEELMERLELRRKALLGAAADQFALIDALRLEAEQETGATWTEPDSVMWREFRAEIAALLHAHERTAQATIEQARMLVHVFPATLRGLRRGRFTERHARILVEEAAGLADELCAEYEELLLPHAETLVPSRFERLARKIAASLAPQDLTAKHEQAKGERRMVLEPAADGMAFFGGYVPAVVAVGAAATVTGLARRLLVDGETRTLAQIEADVFAELLTDAHGLTAPAVEGEQPQPTPGARRGIRPEVYVHVPALTAMGKSMEPGCLEGYGPIDAETARRVASRASSWIRLLTNPETGAIVSFGQDKYRVPADLKRLVEVRDETCRFVGCTRAARYCDLDHTKAWQEHGETVLQNLAALCENHHQLKHKSRWRTSQSPGGYGPLSWTSPHGRVYPTHPATPLPPPRRSRPGARPVAMTAWFEAAEATPPF
ncbi:MAG: uncharacterized protein JWP66_220 [Naasia sp.]|nr:uncharacterized protein [Naasia sp.]